MRIKWWKRNDPRGIIAALVAGPIIAGIWLAGCGGGGGGNNMTTPMGFLLSGTVYAPNRSLSSVAPVVAAKTVGTRQNAAYGPVPNVMVAVGRVDDTGGGFAPLAQTTTDSLGGYTFNLPGGLVPTPNLLVRATSGSTLLENIVTGPTVNISPETTAATELLYSTAHNQGVGLSRLQVGSITSFITQATTIADNALPGNTVAKAIAIANAAFQSKRYAATIAAGLLAVINNAAPPPTVVSTTPRRTPVRGNPVPTTTGGGTTGGTPRATATTSGPPGPPSGGTPGGGTPITRPTTVPPTPGTGQPTPQPTAFPTTQPTTGATPGTTPGTTPRPTTQPTIFGPTVTPGPQITPGPTFTPGANATPTPVTGITPIQRARRRR